MLKRSVESVAADAHSLHWHSLEKIDALNAAEGNASHTTERLRRELLFYLLDNVGAGPIVEVGTMNGGLTSLFAYIGGATGRMCVAIDIDAPRLERTRATCARHQVDTFTEPFLGTLAQYLESPAKVRADLIFIDSSHHYDTTIEEMRAIHRSGRVPRAIGFHDYSYRIKGHLPGECANPIAVDHAIRDFYLREYRGPLPVMKRIGALTGDGLQATPDNPGSVQHDYMEWHGSEGMLLIYP
jgi:predicted O-methyltransferase YrrM